MNIKLSGIVAASMLAMMAIAPMGLAHDDSDLFAVGGASVDRVSGNVVGAAAPRFQLISADIQPDVNPSMDIGFSGGFCDMEVLAGDGSLGDEAYVDGFATGATGALPDVPEGTWDDGGIGAVCHTTNMAGTDYDTWGCGGKYTANAAIADAGPGSTWAVTGCDWGFATGGSAYDPTPFPGIFALEDCVVNQAVLGNVGDVAATASTAVGCADAFGGYATSFTLYPDCFTGMGPSCPAATGGSFTCHDSTQADRTGQDFEDTMSGFDSVAWPTTSAIGSVSCNDGDGVASLFVYNSVTVDLIGSYTGAHTSTVSTVS